MLTETPATKHPRKLANPDLYTEPSPRWVRAELNGTYIVDSKQALLLWDARGIPKYYFPREDVRMDLLQDSDKVAKYPVIGKTIHWHLKVGDQLVEDAVRAHPEPQEEFSHLSEYVHISWSAMDAWYEEEERIYVHPRDPYVRVDALPSSRHIKIEVEGLEVAESDEPTLLFETGLPTRFYLPPEDVRMDMLEPSEHHTGCPYKGEASYYHVHLPDHVHEDFVWFYPDPVPAVDKIEGLICFYNEKVDIYLDGELQERPESPFS